MATITNARDALLKAAAVRIVPVYLNGTRVDYTYVVGDTRPVANADVTQDIMNRGVVVNVVGGGLTLDLAGAVRGGQTAYATGTGFFLGYQNAAYRVSLGNPDGQHLHWDGTSLSLAGSLDYSCITGTRPPSNADHTADAINAGVTVAAGGLSMTGGALRAGQTDYAEGSGFYMGWQPSGVRVSLGSGFPVGPGEVVGSTGSVNTSLNALTWDGAALKMAGHFSGTISTGIGRGPGEGAFHVFDDGEVYVQELTGENISATNTGKPYSSPIFGATMGGTSAVMGVVRSDNTAPYAHGMRGHNARTGSGGVIAAGNGYDFYADGSGTNYGPFTGTHDALWPIGQTIAPGSIVVDKTLIERSGWSSTIFEVELSRAAHQAGVIGVVCAPGVPLEAVQPTAFIAEWLERPPLPHETRGSEQGAGQGTVQAGQPVASMKPSYRPSCALYERLAVNALGEGQVLVCAEGGDIARGDLIVTSSTPGVGMRQADHVLRSVTVAKAREAIVFAPNPPNAEPQPLACIYLCG